jgi:hypothetical protein
MAEKRTHDLALLLDAGAAETDKLAIAAAGLGWAAGLRLVLAHRAGVDDRSLKDRAVLLPGRAERMRGRLESRDKYTNTSLLMACADGHFVTEQELLRLGMPDGHGQLGKHRVAPAVVCCSMWQARWTRAAAATDSSVKQMQ